MQQRTSFILAFFVTVLIVSAAPLGAASFPEEKGIAIGAVGGASFPFEGSYQMGYLVGVTGDYNVSKTVGVRATFGYEHHATSAAGGGSLSATQLLVSGVYSFGGEQVVPFAQAGGGFYTISPPEGGTAGRFGVHVGGGVEAFFNRRTAFVAQGLFHFASGVSDRGGSSFQLGLGLRYYF